MADNDIDNKSLQSALSEEAAKHSDVTKENTPHLYKIIDDVAKSLGIDLEKEKIDFRINKPQSFLYDNSQNAVFISDKNYKAIDIGSGFVSGSVVSGSVLGKELSIELLKGVIAHELKHYRDSKDGNGKGSDTVWTGIKNFILHGDKNYQDKIREYRADFAAAGNEGMIENFTKNATKGIDGQDSDHPSNIYRIKPLMMQWYIREKTGIALTNDDVEHNGKYGFEITNPKKLAAIPDNILREAEKLADNNIEIIQQTSDLLKIQAMAEHIEREKKINDKFGVQYSPSSANSPASTLSSSLIKPVENEKSAGRS